MNEPGAQKKGNTNVLQTCKFVTMKELKMKRHKSQSLKLVNGPPMLLKIWKIKITKTR